MIAGDFFLGGFNGIHDLHAVLTTLPRIPRPKRKRLSFNIAGASRAAYVDEGSWEPRQFELSIAISAQTADDRQRAEDQLFSILASPEPIPFSYYAEPEFTYYIVSNDAADQDRPARMSEVRVWTIKVEADAYKYLNRDTMITLTSPGGVNNFMSYPALPRITIYGTGGTFYWGGQVINMPTIPGNITIDSDEFQQDVYTTAAGGTQTLRPDLVSMLEFPVLAPNSSTNVTWGGSITKVEIEPRWRTI